MRHDTATDKRKKRIRILHITFNMGYGGTEQVIRQLVTNLPTDQFTNRVLCIDGKVGEIGKKIAEEGISVIALKRIPGLDWELAKGIRREIRDQEIDIVHCHQYTPWVYGWLGHLGTSAKVVFTEHGRFHPDRYRFKAAFINPFLAFTTDTVIAISKATKQALGQYEFVPASKIEVIYNGIVGLERDENIAEKVRIELGIPRDATIMGTVARLDPVKNQRMMIKAFAQVLKSHENTWLLIVGDGPDRQMLECLARELRIAHRVAFTGFQDRPVGYLCAMDIFLLSSHTEGTSMTLLEAMSLGIPAVVTSVGGNLEIVQNHVSGMLTSSDEVSMFAKAISQLIENPSTANEMGRQSAEVFRKRFSIETMINAYINEYQSLITR